MIGEKRLLLEQLHNSFPDLISEKVDFYASPTALQILAEVANSFSQEKATQSADFYHDANILEAGKLCNLLQGGLQRLDELISAWPEQMVLVELADRCKALLAVPSTSPLAKLVAFVESLLLKMTDWEAYASRETSLSGFSTPLTALVVDWRRLELKSWAALLDNQEREFRDPISEWWFRMYELCIQGPIALSAKDAVKTSEPDNEYLDTLLNMLRTFVEQTPAGQFRDKLYLIESFGRLTAMLEADSPVFARISSALFNLSSLYEPQALRIDTFLREEKKKIVNDVNEVIRLASWKDVNVYALKASAQKSHRQLYKRVRALRRVLETPSLRFEDDTKVTNLEDSHASLTMRQPPMPVASLHEGFTPLRALCDVPLAKPLLNIEATLSRLMKIVQDDDSVHASAPSDRHLRILVDSILSRSKDLQAEQPSGTTKDEREKQSKALMDRKRKAWSSLLAEAKRIGLSPRPSTMLVQNLSRMASLFNTAPLSNDSSRILAHFGPVLTILDKYFYRMCLLMPRVRSAASQHHPDVDPSQLQAAAGHLDSAFNAAHASRSAISREVHDISITTQAYQKLLVLREHGVATEQLTSPRDSMHALHSCLFYLEAALGESLQSCDDHSQFMTDAEKPAVMQVTGTLRESINEIRASKNEAEAALTEYGNVAPLALSHCHTIHRALRAWKDVGDRLSSAARIAPQMAYLLAPILTWMAKAGKELQWDTAAPALDADDASLSAVQAYATAMSAVLVSIQTLQDQSLPQFEEDGGYAKGGLTIHQKTLVDRIRTLHTASISQHVRALMEKIAELSKHGSGIPLASQLIDR